MAKLREEEGEAVPEEEKEAAALARHRMKETEKEKKSAAGSAPKKKPRVADDRGQTDARFSAPRGLTFPKGSMSDVRADDPRVVWETKQIYMHLVQVFRRDGAAVKMDMLTAPSTEPFFLAKMKTLWHQGFPAYTNVPRVALIAALRAFWLAKRPEN